MPAAFRISVVRTLAAALTVTVGAAAAPPPAACDLAKAAHLEPLIGANAQFIPMIDTRNETAAMTMCAYEGTDGRHYGLVVREQFGTPDKSAAQLRAEAVEALRAKAGIRPEEPDIGEAALWIPGSQQLMIWLRGGRTTLTFIGDETTPDLATHLGIARKVLAALAQ